jgi:hypothetical protein
MMVLKNIANVIAWIASALLALCGLALLSGLFEASLSNALAGTAGRSISPNWEAYYKLIGTILLLLAAALAAFRQIGSVFQRAAAWLRAALHASDHWLEKRSAGQIDLVSARILRWPLDFNRLDGLAIILFALLGLVFQLSVSAQGFPNVILGGDAANIASFAAGRAFPQLFSNDAILGNLGNIGLYVTLHLPITIMLQKLLGNFGLAYSLLLFPHVFLQYFSYYLLGRVLYNNRYWALLFTLVLSSPLFLPGGEVWGIVGDGMPRFTYQVLLPFLLILLLSAWRESPQRWPWVMAAAGLLAFVHPVSTPTWGFALWLGFWPIMPALYDLRRKLLEMLKLGLILALALLPYVSIYLTYKKGGSAGSDYDLVYSILTHYFPENLLNIPSALETYFTITSQNGLLWFGLAGLALTFLLFRSERSRLEQMLTWAAGIIVITILIPFVEQNIERTLRIIPLQTELMRGIRYLLPFLFIFWFYPLAQLTARASRPWLARAALIVGTLSALTWLGLNPPGPVVEIPKVVTCWSQGRVICPNNMDYADAFTFIREDTRPNSLFVAFLTNRWSAIEIRYLGLRPMAYAFKDRGQLAFTNLEALKTWNYFADRENAIYSRSISPTLEIKETRMLDFARDARAKYMLTDFVFPPELLKKFGITVAYQNKTYSILDIFP